MKETETTNEQETKNIETCPRCGALYDRDSREWPDIVCHACEKLFPPALLKAVCDYFDAAVGLRDGTIIRFTTGSIHGDFVHLSNENGLPQLEGRCPYGFARGVDIRLSDIMWCADAPEGS